MTDEEHDSLRRQMAGLVDKLYWRKPYQRYVRSTVWHCYDRVRGDATRWRLLDKAYKYVSLCGRYGMHRVGGQRIRRPPAVMRCGYCDGEEMRRRRVEESMPESKDWEDGV